MSPREPRRTQSRLSSSSDATFSSSREESLITVLGFGSLLSERSSRITFPKLVNFRLGRVPNYRRVFGHPASIFMQRGIGNLSTLEVSSLSAEHHEGSPGFICSVFEVPSDGMMDDGVPSQEFLERESEFNIFMVPFKELDESNDAENLVTSKGILCTRSTDDEFIKRWGKERFQNEYVHFGLDTIWGWKPSSGLKPCPVYLRHCVLAAKSMGLLCFDSFMDETVLVDRETTIRDYLDANSHILRLQPPPELAERYGG